MTVTEQTILNCFITIEKFICLLNHDKMAASSIPNLNSLRRGGRGHARGGLSGRTTHVDKEAVIRSTDNDAATSRMSAVEAGYLDDPFAVYLTDENWQRRLPLMNRGSYNIEHSTSE